ncbi:calcium-binding protein [Pseudaminobacter sp. 19-2017]|uniref:Calcium-binding protein n=1 Tax=Pseudaminobacter soli (ex Zhang et al. 2022) TaxID=2831468 RepID=A0A942I3J6_9HYPH|nr:calcium-binding protein [Pseudaminobacter soli]MBS3650044.1 calcium-binding protein [Pseudaminobacter soli]
MATLHYTSGGSAAEIGTAGFNLVDVQSVEELNALPDGMMGLVWLDEVDGATSSFRDKVDAFKGNDQLFGFFLADEPDPTGQWGTYATAENLKAESDYIHDNVLGAKTFITMMNTGSSAEPSFEGNFNPENTGIDYYGLDPYPVRSESGPVDFEMIDRTVAAAVEAGIPVDQIVPVYQTFGGGEYVTDTDSKYALPTAEQMQVMMEHWDENVPSPAFDYAYAWGSQLGTTTIADSQELQNLFLERNSASAAPDTSAVTDGTDAVVGMDDADVTIDPDDDGADDQVADAADDQPGDQVADATEDGGDEASMSGSHDLDPGSEAEAPATNDAVDAAPTDDAVDAAPTDDAVDAAPTDDAVDAAPTDDAVDAAPTDDAVDAAPTDDAVDAAPTDTSGNEPAPEVTGNTGDNGHGWKGIGHWMSGGRGHEKWHQSGDATAENASGDWHKGIAGADAYAFFQALGAKHADKFIDFSAKHDTIDWGNGHFKSLTKAGPQGASDFAADIQAPAEEPGRSKAYATDTGTFQNDADGAGAEYAAGLAELIKHSKAADFDIV